MRSKNYIVFSTAVVITMMLTATTVGTHTLNILQKANAQNAAVKANTSMPMPNTTTNKAIPPSITLNIKSPLVNKNMTMNPMSNGSMSKMNNMKMMIGGFVQNNITSSISMFKTIGHAIDSSVKVSLSDASKTAEQTVGANSHAVFSMLKPVNDYLVYTVIVVDPTFSYHKVIVDPGTGKVVLNQNMPLLKEVVRKMILMHSGMLGSNIMDDRFGNINIK
ncbi:MAG TPA: PepSY domain-containing protein [Candidatus Nitrosocosmicus sp.]